MYSLYTQITPCPFCSRHISLRVYFRRGPLTPKKSPRWASSGLSLAGCLYHVTCLLLRISQRYLTWLLLSHSRTISSGLRLFSLPAPITRKSLFASVGSNVFYLPLEMQTKNSQHDHRFIYFGSISSLDLHASLHYHCVHETHKLDFPPGLNMNDTNKYNWNVRHVSLITKNLWAIYLQDTT